MMMMPSTWVTHAEDPGLTTEDAEDAGLKVGHFYFQGEEKAQVIFLVRLEQLDP